MESIRQWLAEADSNGRSFHHIILSSLPITEKQLEVYFPHQQLHPPDGLEGSDQSDSMSDSDDHTFQSSRQKPSTVHFDIMPGALQSDV